MATSITIDRIAFDNLVTVNQTVTVAHKLAGEPDANFVIDTTTQNVLPTGVFDPEYVIPNLDYNTHYTVRVSNSCGAGAVAYLTLLTGENPCPDISAIYGIVN